MTSPTQQPAGWYYAQGDPPGTQRWWDGSQWVGGPVAVPSATSAYEPPGFTQGYAPSGYTPSGYTPAPHGGVMVPGASGRAEFAPYAGWWSRVGAAVIDSVVVGVFAFVLVLIGIASVPTEDTFCIDDVGRSYACTQPTDAGVGLIVALAGVGLVGMIAYFTVFVGRSGQTPGRRVAGIAVVDHRAGTPIGFGRALGRYILTVVMGAVCSIVSLIDVLWPLWDDKKQTLHDKAVSSVVVRRNS